MAVVTAWIWWRRDARCARTELGLSGANADVLAFWSAALGEPCELAAAEGGLWGPRSIVCRVGSGVILGCHTRLGGGGGDRGAARRPSDRCHRRLVYHGRVWDLSTMTVIQEPHHLVGAISLAAITLPTGLYIAAAGDGTTAPSYVVHRGAVAVLQHMARHQDLVEAQVFGLPSGAQDEVAVVTCPLRRFEGYTRLH
jgi:hypothetical protein